MCVWARNLAYKVHIHSQAEMRQEQDYAPIAANFDTYKSESALNDNIDDDDDNNDDDDGTRPDLDSPEEEVSDVGGNTCDHQNNATDEVM